MTKQEQITRVSNERGYVVDKNGVVTNIDGKTISLGKTAKGYFSFNIRLEKGQNPTRSFVHKLQAFQKFGDTIFEENVVVRHLNGLSTDNSYENIGIGTQSENMLDIPKEKRVLTASQANLKYNHQDIINDRNNGFTFTEIMAKYDISSKGTVSFIIKKSLESTK